MTRPTPIDDAPHQEAAMSSPAPETHFARRPWLLALVLVIVTFVAYQPTWHAGFIWDDDDHLTANPAMTAPHGLKMIWSSLAVGRYYPLTLTTFWFQRRLWGLHPLPYHLVNVLLHAANGVLVFFILRRLRVPGAWLAAMVWALHPVNVESVAWITELKNTQSGLFFFLAVWCFLRFDAGAARRRWYGLALLCGLAALLSKPSTVVLPLALLLCVWWQRGSWRRADILRIAPFLMLALGMSALTVIEQRGHIQRESTVEWNLGMAERLVIAGKAVWFYASKVLWPARLTFVYPRWNLDAGSFWSWLPVAGLVAGGALLWARRRQSWARAGLFGCGFFVLALLPVLGFVDVYYFRYSFVADHFQYLASLGLISLAASMGTAIGNRAGPWGRSLGTVAAAIVLLTLGVSTWRQARIYQNSETLWGDTLAKNPRCWMAHNNLGNVLVHEGKGSDAIGHFEQAVQIKPDDAEAYSNLGNALEQAGQMGEAIPHYEHALRIRPDLAEAHNNLASALYRAGQREEAIAQYEQSLRLKPDFALAHYNLGNALTRAGRVPEAIEHFEQALRIKPDYAEAHEGLGTALAQTGKVKDAIECYRQALRLQPDYVEAHYNLGIALWQTGSSKEAIEHFEQALRIKPDYAEAHCNLGTALAQAGRMPEAIEHLEQALRIKPDYAEAHYNLGIALAQTARIPEAIDHLEQALRIKPDFAEARTALARLQSRQ
ncbi:MAG: tetratricopeptide repeat protein [Verrucomicrobiia bacterium]